MPSFFSFGPTEKPGSSLCTTNAEMPLAFFSASGSVTAITVYQDDSPAFVIHALVPLSTQWSPSSRARVRIDAVSEPASRSESAYEAEASPDAIEGSTSFFTLSEADRMIGCVPSLFTAGISDADASTRATSSITMQAPTASAPWPSYSSPMWTALKPDLTSALYASIG